jgi:NADH dehydrogenase FAD-containing subunit
VPRLLLLGSGFGAFSVLRDLDPALYDITLASPRNHFVRVLLDWVTSQIFGRDISRF